MSARWSDYVHLAQVVEHVETFMAPNINAVISSSKKVEINFLSYLMG